MTELLQKAFAEVSKLPERKQDAFAAWILEQLALEESEADWEEAVLSKALGDALRPDGSIDFDKLRATGLTMTLDELYSESAEDDEA